MNQNNVTLMASKAPGPKAGSFAEAYTGRAFSSEKREGKTNSRTTGSNKGLGFPREGGKKTGNLGTFQHLKRGVVTSGESWGGHDKEKQGGSVGADKAERGEEWGRNLGESKEASRYR